MHELAVTENILAVALSHAQENKAKEITKVAVQIGQMTGVVEDCVRFYFDLVSKGTLAEKAKLDVESIPAQAVCSRCQKKFEVDEYEISCPYCGSLGGKIVSGRELCVSSIEIE